MDETDTPVTAPSVDGDAAELPEGIDIEGKELDPAESTTEIDPAYVARLRTEAAEARIKLQKLDEYETKMFDVIVADEAKQQLRDASDFIVTDRASLLGEDGYPSREKISAAISELVTAKPYLAKVVGQVGAGARPATEETVSLTGLLRNAAR